MLRISQKAYAKCKCYLNTITSLCLIPKAAPSRSSHQPSKQTLHRFGEDITDLGEEHLYGEYKYFSRIGLMWEHRIGEYGLGTTCKKEVNTYMTDEED